MTDIGLTDEGVVQLLQDALVGLRELDRSSHDVIHRINQIKNQADQLGYCLDDDLNMHKWIAFDEAMQRERKDWRGKIRAGSSWKLHTGKCGNG